MSYLDHGARWPTVGVNLPAPMIDRIEELARREGLGKSAFLRRLAIRELERIDADQPREAA